MEIKFAQFKDIHIISPDVSVRKMLSTNTEQTLEG